MKKIIKVFGNLSEISVQLITLGTKLALGVLLTGIFAYKYNQWIIQGVRNETFALQIVMAAWNLFVIFILGGIAMDCAQKRK